MGCDLSPTQACFGVASLRLLSFGILLKIVLCQDLLNGDAYFALEED